MSETFNYEFTDPSGGTVDITVTTSTTLSNITGDGQNDGQGYAVTAISGSVDGVAIHGEVGTGGVAVNDGSFIYDNAIFPAAASGASGSTDGIDDLKALAAKSPTPPEGFTVKSFAEVENDKHAAFAAAHPDLARWLEVKKALVDGGEAYFKDNVAEAGMPKLKG